MLTTLQFEFGSNSATLGEGATVACERGDLVCGGLACVVGDRRGAGVDGAGTRVGTTADAACTGEPTGVATIGSETGGGQAGVGGEAGAGEAAPPRSRKVNLSAPEPGVPTTMN